MDGRVRVVEQAPQHPALGAQRVGDERMGRDGQAARVVHVGDGRAQRAVGPDGRVDAQGQQVAAERGDLLADDDVEREAAVAGHRPAGHGGIDAFVVGDGDDVEVAARATCSRIARTSAVPSEATVWMCRSARPVPLRSVRPVTPPASLEVRPDREEDRPPLLRGVLDDALEGRGERAVVAVTRSRREPSPARRRARGAPGSARGPSAGRP